MSIIVENLSKHYGTQKAVDSISFEAKPGEVLGFLGPNGAGKSTTMKMLTCYIPPTSGTATVCNFSITEKPLEVRKVIGYLPELNPLYTDMYVREYLRFMAQIHGLGKTAKKRVEEMISNVGLTPEAHKKIGQLSKGYRQRVGLAQSMLHNPKVLILDEPTSGLDPNQIVDIRNLIQEIGRDRTVILSTHIMQEVQAMCKRVIIINQGKIVADDLTENLGKQEIEEYIIIVEFGKEINDNILKKMGGVKSITRLQSNQYRLICDKDIREQINKAAYENNMNLLGLSLEKQKLEDVFKTLTKKDQ
ncbi:MAG: gliding motility-associated ABC transporter ATP-binding subunit GldA [Bacteroidota bacterium]|nr:gliding motility-associated ABC transporter ATP-binding subunit GldA [Bacteroidota bacterium]